MNLVVRMVTNGVGEQGFTFNARTPADLRQLARKLDRLVRDTQRVVPSFSRAQLTKFSVRSE